MKYILMTCAAVASLMSSTDADANLITTFSLSNVSFQDGGTASGQLSLDYNGNFYVVGSADITTTAGSQFGGAHYTSNFGSLTISGTSLFGSNAYNINAWVFSFSTPGSNLFLNILGYPTLISTSTPSALNALSSYPGEFSQGVSRAFASGSLDPISTIDTSPQQPPDEPGGPPSSSIPEPGTIFIWATCVLLMTWSRTIRRRLSAA